MAAKNDESLGWGTIGFWFGVVALFMAVLAFGVLMPSRTDQASNTAPSQEQPQRQQPVPQSPTNESTR